MNERAVFILMIEHPVKVFRHVLGVFSTSEKAKEAATWVTCETTIYNVLFLYTATPQCGEFVLVNTTDCDDRCVPKVASSIDIEFEDQDEVLLTLFDPSKEYVAEYATTLATESAVLLGEVNPDTLSEFVDREVEEDDDISDEQKEMLNEMLDFLP